MRGTLRHSADLPQDISSGMQHQMDLMENTFLLFLLLFLPLLTSPRLFSSSSVGPLSTHFLSPPSAWPPIHPLPRCDHLTPPPPKAHTPPHLPFVCCCGMFAFLNSLGHDVFGGRHARKAALHMSRGKRKLLNSSFKCGGVSLPVCVAVASTDEISQLYQYFFKNAAKRGEKVELMST